MMNNGQRTDNTKFLSALTLGLIVVSLWIFSPYLHYLLVGAVLALATSHVYVALVNVLENANAPAWLKKSKSAIAAALLTLFFLVMIFFPLIFFISVTYDQVSGMDLGQVKQTVTEIAEKAFASLERIPILKTPLNRLQSEGLEFLKGTGIEVLANGVKGLVSGAGALFGQVVWILLFYFLFNLYGHQILRFATRLMPMSFEHEKYLYRESTGTVAVVFYGTLFNMAAQGLAFGVLMAVIGGYDALYLGVLTGFCSVVPLVGAALVYLPIIALELLAGHYLTALVIFGFAWVVMGFLIDNILRLVFIGYLKKMFGFQYTMNEILILLAIMAGIATFGFWGLIIGPSVLALTLAAANLFSSQNVESAESEVSKMDNPDSDRSASDQGSV
jgi:predicted PurR-regulated permease PerM